MVPHIHLLLAHSLLCTIHCVQVLCFLSDKAMVVGIMDLTDMLCNSWKNTDLRSQLGGNFNARSHSKCSRGQCQTETGSVDGRW